MFATGIGEQDMAHASEEKGRPSQDDFLVLEGP